MDGADNDNKVRRRGARDLVRRKPGRQSWTFSIRVPRDLIGVVLGAKREDGTRKPVKVVERQLKATDHAAAVREAATMRADVFNEWERLRYQKRKAAADPSEWRVTWHFAQHMDSDPSPRITELIEPYVTSRASLAEKTRGMIRASLKLLAAHHGRTLAKLDRRVVERWADAMAAQGLAPATCNAHISKCSGFWRWAKKRGHVEGESPFADQWLEGEGKRERFTIDELNKLTQPSPLRWHILAVLFAGLRLSELVKARVEHGAFFIAEEEADGKTEAAERIIPLHSTMIRLGFESEWSKANTIPADTVSEKFTAWRRSHGIGAPEGERSDKTFHSLRHNFARGSAMPARLRRCMTL